MLRDKFLCLIVVVLALSLPLSAQSSGTIGTSGGSVGLVCSVIALTGGGHLQFTVNDTPTGTSTLTVTVKGCWGNGPCNLLDTYSPTSPVSRPVGSLVNYSYLLISATYTGSGQVAFTC